MKIGRGKKEHDSRVDNIQEMARQYYRNEIGEIPPLDKGFMEVGKAGVQKRVRVRRYLPVAAAIIAVFLVGNVIAAVTLEDSAYGDRGILYRIYQSMRGIYSDKENEPTGNEVSEEATISDWSDIDTAIIFSDGALYIPEYIPETYSFEGLEMQNTSMGDFSATYTFKDGTSKLIISEIYSPRVGEISCTVDGELIKLIDRELYIQDRDSDGNIFVSIYTENAIIQIMGPLSEDEAVNIAKNMNKSN